MALPYRCPVHVTSRSRDNAHSRQSQLVPTTTVARGLPVSLRGMFG